MHIIRKYRIAALLCAFAVLLCELISRPYVEIGISDDAPYVLMARTLATSGHVTYNGWATAMLGWQLYIGAAFIKLFGFSFTTVRMSTLLVSLATVMFLQRIFVRAGIHERNAALATSALALSPLYLLLSVTYMSDIFGLFAVVICLYGCLRALQSTTPNATIFWLCFAAATNGLFGTARQIAWLGILVMLPSTLWLLRAQRRVLIAGSAATAAGAIFIFACMQWFKRQPYSVPEHILPNAFPIGLVARHLSFLFLDATFLLLPLFAIFLACFWNRNRVSITIVVLACVSYTLLSLHRGYPFLMQPLWGDWNDAHGMYEEVHLFGLQPVFLPHSLRLLFTIGSLGGLLGLVLSFFRARRLAPPTDLPAILPWNQLLIVLMPFALAYTLLLLPRAAEDSTFDRYLLPLLVLAALCLVRYYQERVAPQLGIVCALLIFLMAAYGVTTTHNMFSFYRSRAALAAELRVNGVPNTAVDLGWEDNFGTELQYADHLNFPTINVPADAYIPTPPPPPGPCTLWWYDYTPHIHPLYGFSFDPNACAGPAPFAPVHYSTWPTKTLGTLYVVRYTAPAKL